MSEREKYRQICREAKLTGTLLGALIVFWLIAGFGASHIEVEIFRLPLWVITSTVGVWLAAILGVKILISCVFRDLDLDTEAENADTE